MNIEMTHIFMYLFTAHLISDFILQNDSDAEGKSESKILFKHVLITSITAYFILGVWNAWWITVIIFFSHAIIDWLKILSDNRYIYKRLLIFVVDQILHIAVLIFLALYLSRTGITEIYWVSLFGSGFIKLLIIVSGIILTVNVGKVAVGIFVSPYLEQINEEVNESNIRGLNKGGELIGKLERSLIFFFVMTNIFSAIGFLIAAKSVFRFAELKERQNRMEAEYILIGTLYSFGWGLLFSWLTKEILYTLF